MQRIIDTTATGSLPAPPALTGTTGYFTEGSPGVTPATRVRGWWVNMIQEELLSLLTAAGIAFDTTASNFTQVLAAIRQLNAHGRFESNASTTWTVPAGVTFALFEVWGSTSGSGGSASTGAGGGAGGAGYSRKAVAVTPGTVYTFTAGAGGTPGGTGTSGGAGGTTTLSGTGVSISCATSGVGVGGGAGVGGAGGAGAAAPTGGDVNMAGSIGSGGIVNGTLYLGGAGGASPFGGSTTCISVGTGEPGVLPGGGAGGGANSQNGVAGNAGYFRVTW